MAHYKGWPNKSLIRADKANEFMELFDCEPPVYREVAKCLFIDGMTAEKAGQEVGYSTRQIERLRTDLLKKAVVRLLDRR